MRASSASRSVRRPTSTVGRTNSRVGIVALNGRPVRAITSSARTTRRPLFGSIASAARGSAAAQLGEQGRDPLVGRAAACRAARTSGRSAGSRAGRAPPARRAPTRPRPRAGAAAPARPRCRRGRAAGRRRRWPPAVTSSTSSWWCAMPCRSSSGHLGGADVHPAVELRGVGADDLAAQPQGERDGEVGLAGGGRADDRDDEVLHVSRCARPRASRRRGRTGRGPHPASTTGPGTPQPWPLTALRALRAHLPVEPVDVEEPVEVVVLVLQHPGEPAGGLVADLGAVERQPGEGGGLAAAQRVATRPAPTGTPRPPRAGRARRRPAWPR